MWSPDGPPILTTSPRLGWTKDGPAPGDVPVRLGWWATRERDAVDIGRGSDAADASVLLSGYDIGFGSDSAELTALLSGIDIGRGLDSADASVFLSGYDIGSGSDSALAAILLSGYDTGRGSDSAELTVLLSGANAGTGSDQSAIDRVASEASDVGLGMDGAMPRFLNGWSGSKSQTQLPSSSWTDLLTFTADGAWGGKATFTVQHSWGSHVLHWASETRGIRILVGGAQVAIQTQSYTTGSWSSTLTQTNVPVAANALVRIQGYCEGLLYSEPRRVTIPSASMTVTGV